MAASPAAASLVEPGEKATVRMGFVRPVALSDEAPLGKGVHDWAYL